MSATAHGSGGANRAHGAGPASGDEVAGGGNDRTGSGNDGNEVSPDVLAGVRVVELASVVSGPYAGLMLAHLGADVVKIESPSGDLTRTFGPRHNGVSAYFYNFNAGKRSIVLDLRTPDGARVARELIGQADVVIENWRPGVAGRLGLDWDAMRSEFPRLITVAVRGYGDDGPYANDRVFDPVIQGVAGIAATQGDERPVLVHTVLADKVSSMAAVQGVLAALLERAQTGRGRHVQVNMLDAAVTFLWPEMMRGLTFADADGPGHGPGRAPRPSSVVRAGDGRWLAYTTVDEAGWKGMCDVARRPDLFEPYRKVGRRAVAADAIAEELGGAFADRTRDEVLAELRAAGVPCGPVNEADEVIDDPQVVRNNLARTVEREGLGRVVEMTAPVPTATDERRWLGPAPALGQHTDEILAELGYDAAAIERLHTEGAAVQERPPAAP